MEDTQTLATGSQSSNENSAGMESFDRLLSELKSTISRFQDDQTPESFAAIISSLSQFGISGADIWQRAAEYTKKNPLKVAIYAGLGFFALKGLMGGQNKPAQAALHH